MKKLFLAMAIAIVTATAVSAQKKENMMVVSSVQADKNNGYAGNSAIHCGIRFNIKLSGVTKIELESVDGNPLAGKARWQARRISRRTIKKMQQWKWQRAQAPLSHSRLPTNPASCPERIIISRPCLATFTADTDFLFAKMALWLITLAYIRQWILEHL